MKFSALSKFLACVLCIGFSSHAFAYDLMLSQMANRSAAVPLQNSSLSGNAYIFVTPEADINQVEFYLDNLNSPRIQRERQAPFDLAGGTSSSANPFNTIVWTDGPHTLLAVIKKVDGTSETISSGFTVNNNAPSIITSPSSVSITTDIGGPVQSTTTAVSLSDGANLGVTVTENASWLNTATFINTPGDLQLDFNPSGLVAGTYTENITLSVNGYSNAVIVAQLIVQSASGSYSLLLSQSASRENPTSLNGATLTGNAYIFVLPENGINKVDFYIDSLSGPVFKSEKFKPYDLAGGTNSAANPFDTTTLSDGTHTFYAVVDDAVGADQILSASVTVLNNSSTPAFTLNPNSVNATLAQDSNQDYTVLLGLNAAADGSSPNYTVNGGASWVSVTPATGNAPESLTVAIDTTGLAPGGYNSTVTISSNTLADILLPVNLSVTGSSGQPNLQATPSGINTSSAPNQGIVTESVTIGTSDSSSTTVNVNDNASWLTPSASSLQSGQSIDLFINTDGLAENTYSASVIFSATGYNSISVPVTLVISNADNCAPLVCSEIKVDLPYVLEFDTDAGHLADANGIGTGFTYFQPSSRGSNPGYDPTLLNVDLASGELLLSTTSGSNSDDSNNLSNGLGVGFGGPDQVTEISTLIRAPAATPALGKYEQAGLWFGIDEDNYIKLIYLSSKSGYKVELLLEVNGQREARTIRSVPDLSAAELRLQMVTDPITRTVTGRYALSEGEFINVDSFAVPPDFFSFDAAGIDPEIGTRSFAGIMASDRSGPGPLTYRFEEFIIQEGVAPPTESLLAFSRVSHSGVNFPTSMVWGPDGRLYVAELFGNIHALTYDADLNVINDELITSLVDSNGPRLTLGITIDPYATANNIVLWVSNSSPSINSGALNSGMVTKLSGYTSGSGFATVENVITGLPRAEANHAPNSLHFGSDGRLYMTVGGNTGAGAPTSVETEFGQRPEQYLSAGMVVADVYAPSFNGNCTPSPDPVLSMPSCDVTNYVTGLRNSYDFVEHSNGFIYATDNGLGVTGAFPPSPTPPCFGFGSTNSVGSGGQNPGEQPDLLVRIVEGAYYGHPNPSRDECVFKNGALQGVAPPLNYMPPLTELGNHLSSNGIIEVKSDQLACGAIQGDLLITNFSTGNNVMRIQLNTDGTIVESQSNFIDGFNNPLALAENANGDLFVAEFGANRITALRGIDPGCWETLTPMPQEILDPASTAIGNDLYVIGGKRTAHTNEAYRYDTTTDTWTQIANKPGSAVENAAAASVGGMLYVFGGSTEPFSGAVNESYRYNPATDTWSQMANMPTARGGVRAEAVNGLIYVIGGMDNAGNSLNVVEIYNPANNTWSPAAPMQQVRDNPGTAVIGGKIYAVGGRERLASGSVVNATLGHLEVYDPVINSWSTLAPMPTGRRTMVVGTLNGLLQVIGGEENTSNANGIFTENEQYNPATDTWIQLGSAPNPKHGAAYATINNRIYQVGGGVTSGTSFTSTVNRY